jgi:uncharacterized protein (DUF2252 family)
MAKIGDSAIQRILRFNAGRDPERLALKYQAMRVNAFAFLRATCHLFYDELPKPKLLRNAPLAWVCGDLHLENFGSYKGDNRLVYFDLNDFDEAVLAPCTWDLLRFLTSVLVGAATLKLTNAQAKSLCVRFLDAYVAAIQDGKARWVEQETAQGMVKELLDSLRTRKRKAFLDRYAIRAGNRRKIRVDGKRALPVTATQRARIKAFMRTFAQRQPNPTFYRVIDVARRVAGTGSLGVERYVLLVEGKGSPDGNYLLDLKQALPSALSPQLAWKQPKWRSAAHRVVTLQHRVQAISMAFLTPVIIGKTAYVLRGLQPIEDRVALDDWNGDLSRLEAVMATMGQLVAWGQLRSSAREGSATADDLVSFWAKRGRTLKLLRLALDCKAQVERDWRDYCQAYDRVPVPQLKAARKGAKTNAA